jgi:predicted CoA-binding protein
MILLTTSEQHALLARSIRVAVVGASPNASRPNFDVFHYLRTRPLLDVAPINAAVSTIDGIEAYPTLRAYARVWGAPDIVTVCRNPADVAKIAHQAIAVGAKAIWFQPGVATDEAIEIADRAGLDVVAERNIEAEFNRLAEPMEHARSTIRFDLH